MIFLKYCNYKDSLELEVEEIMKNMPHTVKAVVIKVNEETLDAMRIEEAPKGLLNVKFADEGNIGFKQGQEILINYRGGTIISSPSKITKTDKIEILKEKSDIEIPEQYLKYCYSSKDNVKVTINEFTNESLELTIVDTNEWPYEYSSEYSILKKEHLQNPVDENQMQKTIAVYTYKEIKKIPNISIEDTVENKAYNLPNITENENYIVKGWKFNFSKIYGKLETGNYEFSLKSKSLLITIDFRIDERGKVKYGAPSIET